MPDDFGAQLGLDGSETPVRRDLEVENAGVQLGLGGLDTDVQTEHGLQAALTTERQDA